jgi:hypothetical protein
MRMASHTPLQTKQVIHHTVMSAARELNESSVSLPSAGARRRKRVDRRAFAPRHGLQKD